MSLLTSQVVGLIECEFPVADLLEDPTSTSELPLISRTRLVTAERRDFVVADTLQLEQDLHHEFRVLMGRLSHQLM